MVLTQAEKQPAEPAELEVPLSLQSQRSPTMAALRLASSLVAVAAVSHVISRGERLTPVREVRSSDGVLRVTLVVALLRVRLGNLTWTTRAYNGSFPGPTLVLRAGDRLEMTLVNALQDVAEVGVFNEFRDANYTSMHLHGLHASPAEDDVFAVVRPGESRLLTYHIPADHAPGLFWYHAHNHGSAAFQVAGGMEGTLVIEEDPGVDLPRAIASLETHDCNVLVLPFAAISENAKYSAVSGKDPFPPRNVVLQGHDPAVDYAGSTNGVYGNRVVSDAKHVRRDVGTVFVVNGHARPAIELKANVWTRLRVVFASANYWLHLATVCETRLIAKDGIYVDDAPRPFRVAALFPGGRTDFLVRCATPGTYDWVSVKASVANPIDRTAFDPVVLSFVVSSDTSSASSASSLPLPWSPRRPCYLRDLRRDDVARRYLLRFDDTPFELASLRWNEEHGFPGVKTIPGNLRVNGRAFNLEEPLFDVPRDDVLEFNFSVGPYEHPIHVHTFPFQLVGGHSDYLADGDWHDTLAVAEDSAVVRLHTARFAGKLLVHCHNLAHEDEGMMAWLNVSSERATSYCPHRDGCWCSKPRRAFTLRRRDALFYVQQQRRRAVFGFFSAVVITALLSLLVFVVGTSSWSAAARRVNRDDPVKY
mmetsp:Transcript_5161/g.16235  ORF Transcript_5161/g.16235 Transcript_5161/m.16235 type:complete len:647 (+) Transcript_5161:1357-3297(+)